MREAVDRRGAARFLLPGVLGLLVGLPLAAQGDGACEANEGHRALDFLVGQWQLVSGGEAVGRSEVEKLEDECLIAETWAFADGRSGRTYSSFDAAAGVWRRFSVSNRGAMVRSSGTVEGNALLARGERTTAEGGTSNWRERLTREAAGRIAWVAGHQAEGIEGERAATVVFEGYYVPVGEPVPPVPAPAPVEPEPVLAEPEQAASPTRSDPQTAAVTGAVTPHSARAADAVNIERIAMESPMVLRLSLGDVAALPSGYAWITRDTAPYLCEGVTIKRVEVARRERRGRVELQVELALHAAQLNERVEVEIELHRVGQQDPGAVAASGSASGRVGRGIPEQINEGSVAFTVSLPMTREVFDSAVAGAERPDLVITLAVEK